MTRDEAVSIILSRCVRPGDQLLTTQCYTEMKMVIENILEGGDTLPWFLLSEFLTASTVIGEERVELPLNVGGVTGRDFLREHETCSLWIMPDGDTKWIELIKDDYDALYTALGGGSDSYGQPTHYSLDNQYFYLKPTPDKVYQLRMRVYLRDTPLTSNIENAWLKHAADLVIAETGTIIAGSYLRDTEAEAKFRDEAQKARNRLYIFHEAREHTGRSYSMGD